MRDQTFYNVVAATMVLAVAIGGLVVPAAWPSSSNDASNSMARSYLNLTIAENATTGWPQYTPANFSVPVGEVVVTIVDRDVPMNWTSCGCQVAGTIGDIEYVNGSAVTTVPSSNVAHTFTIDGLGLNVLSPGESTVQFLLKLDIPGIFTWYCLAPCGGGPNSYSTAPMGIDGYMTGTMTVT